MINAPKRPMILAGHGIIDADAIEAVARARRADQHSGRATLLGLGGFPATHPLSLGMMGMHGEAWVNHAIQEADLLIALGMRFDDRVTGNLKTYAPNAKKIHVEIDPAEINKNVKVDVALVGDVREILRMLLPHRRSARARRMDRSTSTRSRATRRCATSRRCPTTGACLPRTSSTTCGATPKARRWSSPTWASTRCGKRSTTSTTTRAS